MAVSERYIRQVALDEIGPEGQGRIRSLRILVVGAGGLGTPASLYLAAAGVGEIVVADPDKVELSNLQRQVLYRYEDIGVGKAAKLAGRLGAANPDVTVSAVAECYEESNATELTERCDVVVGATDSFSSRMLIASTCRDLGIPYVYCGINRHEVQVMSVIPGKTSCFACLYGEAQDSDESPAGPIGAIAGIGGAIQAAEALKIGVGYGEPLYNRLLVFDSLDMNVRIVHVARRGDCVVCRGIN